MKEVIFGFIVGTLVAAGLVILHIITQAIKREYYDVGTVALPIKDKDPELYAALYRAKQHARRVARPPLPAGTGIRGKLMHAYVNLQPDSRYLRLERNLSKLVTGAVTDEKKRAATVKRCNKDLAFLDAPSKPPSRHNFIVGMVLALAKRLLLPQRDGPTEPDTVEARATVKSLLTSRIAAYAP